MRFYARVDRLRGSSLDRRPREKNALEGALRGARLRLAREAYSFRRCAMNGSHGGRLAPFAPMQPPISRRFLAGARSLGTSPRSAPPDRVAAYHHPALKPLQRPQGSALPPIRPSRGSQMLNLSISPLFLSVLRTYSISWRGHPSPYQETWHPEAQIP
jgi:hypothetical protein